MKRTEDTIADMPSLSEAIKSFGRFKRKMERATILQNNKIKEK